MCYAKITSYAFEIHRYMPNTYLDHTTTSEYSLTRYYNDWFFYGVAVWIDILRRRITKWVKNSITYSDLHENGDNNDVFYMNNNEQDMNVSCGTSALDTAEMFHAVNIIYLDSITFFSK